MFRADVRVLLSLEKSKELTVTPVGKFSLKEAPDFKVGNEPIKFSVVGGRISLKAGEKQISAPSFTLLSENYNKTEDYIRLKNSEHGTCTYLGNMYFEARQGAILAINTLPVEQYLYGVVPHEMS
ncbi:MAG TPA: SpoIID/LytB domain-containing protein, partial [Clostridia bacterium]|nr:SpoIID/LytB domain-containing protein [Clostridia bacterium]